MRNDKTAPMLEFLDRFELLDAQGQIVAAITDTPSMTEPIKDMLLGWIRNGYRVIHTCARALDCATCATSDKATVAAPAPGLRQKRHYTRKPRKPKNAKVQKVQKTYTVQFPIGAKAYLRWTALTDEQKLHLSQYRTTPGQVEALPARGKRTVRFNDDPPETLSIDQLSSAPYVE